MLIFYALKAIGLSNYLSSHLQMTDFILQSKTLNGFNVRMSVGFGDTRREIVRSFIAHLSDELVDRGMTEKTYGLNIDHFTIGRLFYNQEKVSIFWRG